MAYTALNPQKATTAGVAITFSAADGVNGNSWIAAHGRALHVKNGSGAPITVTIPTPGNVDTSLAIADRAVTVAASAHAVISITPDHTEYKQSDGKIHADFSSATTVTVAVIDQP